MTDMDERRMGVTIARPLFSLEDDLQTCDCEKRGPNEAHLRHKGARWPIPFEGSDLDEYTGDWATRFDTRIT